MFFCLFAFPERHSTTKPFFVFLSFFFVFCFFVPAQNVRAEILSMLVIAVSVDHIRAFFFFFMFAFFACFVGAHVNRCIFIFFIYI